MEKSRYKFFRQTEKIEETINAVHDPVKEWHPDPKGYFLIRINPEQKRIEVGFTSYRHVITKKIYGHNAIELYHTIIRHNIISKLEHAAYLGKELYKAELALRYGKPYRQEFSLDFPEVKEKIKVRNS